jgi:hypothetical protein
VCAFLTFRAGGKQKQRKKQNKAAKRPPTLPYGEYRAMALNALRIDDDEALLRATEFLHELGSLVYFRKPGLSDITILDPHWSAPLPNRTTHDTTRHELTRHTHDLG